MRPWSPGCGCSFPQLFAQCFSSQTRHISHSSKLAGKGDSTSLKKKKNKQGDCMEFNGAPLQSGLCRVTGGTLAYHNQNWETVTSHHSREPVTISFGKCVL